MTLIYWTEKLVKYYLLTCIQCDNRVDFTYVSDIILYCIKSFKRFSTTILNK